MAGVNDVSQSVPDASATVGSDTIGANFSDQLGLFIKDMTSRLAGQSQLPTDQLGLFIQDMTSRLNGGGSPADQLGPFIQDMEGRLNGSGGTTDTGASAPATQSNPSMSTSSSGSETSPNSSTTGGNTAQETPNTSGSDTPPANSDDSPGTASSSSASSQGPASSIVEDVNGNKLFDSADVSGVKYNKDEISTTLAERPERVILMGEDHRDQPTDTVEATIKKIADSGRPVIYTVEASAKYLRANGPDLIEQLNNGKITPEDFQKRFVDRLQTVYGADLAVDAVQLADQIVRMHNAGAKVVPVDDGAYDVIQQFNQLEKSQPLYGAGGTSPSQPDISQISGVNRDELMAKNIIKLYNENPDATIVSSIGGVHTQVNVDVQNNFGSTDSSNPVGTRLLEQLGRDNVFSVYNYMTEGSDMYPYYEMAADGYINGEFGQQVASNTWDMIAPSNGS
jgi:hypothetical protein